jgi:hypothetical protein
MQNDVSLHSRLLHRLHHQEQRLACMRELLAVQGLDCKADLAQYIARLQQRCAPEQEMAWLLRDCASFEEVRSRLETAVDFDGAAAEVLPLEQVSVIQQAVAFQRENRSLRAANEALLARVRALESRPVDHVPHGLYAATVAELEGLRERHDALSRKVEQRPEQAAQWASLSAYWRREAHLLEHLVNLKLEVEGLRAPLSMTDAPSSPSAATAQQLEGMVTALKPKAMAEFREAVVLQRSEYMADVLTRVRDAEAVRELKNSTIQAQQSTISRLERCLGLRAADVAAAQDDVDRLRGVAKVLEDDMRVARLQRQSQAEVAARERDNLERMVVARADEERQSRRLAADNERMAGELRRLEGGVAARREELESLAREAADLRSGELARKVRDTRNELHRLSEAADAARRTVERLGGENEELVGEVRVCWPRLCVHPCFA